MADGDILPAISTVLNSYILDGYSGKKDCKVLILSNQDEGQTLYKEDVSELIDQLNAVANTLSLRPTVQ